MGATRARALRGHLPHLAGWRWSRPFELRHLLLASLLLGLAFHLLAPAPRHPAPPPPGAFTPPWEAR